MSNAQFPLEIARTIDPVVDINNDRFYTVMEGGRTVNYFPLTSTSFSNGSITFSTTTPNLETIIDRKLKMKMPVTIDFVGTTVDPASNLLQTGFDAFRAFPISSIIRTSQVQINNQRASIDLSDIIHPLMRYNQCRDNKELHYSTTPNMQDQYQEYADGAGAVNNPLAAYQDNSYVTPRGAFPYTITNHTNTTATVQATLTENLFLSPFIWGKIEESGFVGVQELTFTFTLNNLPRIWSHSDAGGSTLTSINVTLGQPTLLFKQITSKMTQKIPKMMRYPYYTVTRYLTDTNAPISPNATSTLISANIQLGSIPKQMYIYAREREGDRTFQTTDTYFAINQISVNWGTERFLSAATQEDLYDISVRNGCNLSWPQWSGTTTRSLGSTDTTVGTVGSVLNLVYGKDIGLSEKEAPGQRGTYQLFVNVDVKNVNQSRAIIPTLYIVVVDEGVCTIANNRVLLETGVITQKDVLDAASKPIIPYEDVHTVYGGNFLDSLKKFGSTIWKGLKKYGPPAIKVASTLAPLLALGEDGEYYPVDEEEMMEIAAGRKKKGGVVVGGRKLSRKDMMKRLTSM